jgi:hypothetical protein
MTKPKKRRTGGAEPERGRTVKITKPKKRRTGGAEPEGPEGSSITVPREFLARRLEGGAPATPEAYAHAIEQWQQLPGAVLSRTQISPTPVRPSTAVPTPTIDTESEEQPS